MAITKPNKISAQGKSSRDPPSPHKPSDPPSSLARKSSRVPRPSFKLTNSLTPSSRPSVSLASQPSLSRPSLKAADLSRPSLKAADSFTSVSSSSSHCSPPLLKASASFATISSTTSPQSLRYSSVGHDGDSRASTPESQGHISVTDSEVDPQLELDNVKKTWRSPIYSFFKSDVSIEYHDGRLVHFFPCAARVCKTSLGGVRRFQDSKDKASTANLRHHAIRCFGEDAVKTAMSVKDAETQSGSIFAAFARQGQQPVQHSHRSLTNTELRAHVVKWVTENSRPANIVTDRDLKAIVLSGRPHTILPSVSTIARDVKASFKSSRDKISKMLKDYPGRLHFATDSWTSPNHRALVAWTVHLQYEGKMLEFLLDTVEVPESHTGVVLANAFQGMLERFGLEEKIHSVTADNASSNDVQIETLYGLDNSFHQANHIRCFNHTIQLAAKALIAPFNAGMGKADSGVEISHGDSAMLEDFLLHEDNTDTDDEGEEGKEGKDDAGFFEDMYDGDGDADALGGDETLSEEEHIALLNDTSAVRETVSKLRQLSFAIVHSTTIALPAWRRFCRMHGLKDRLIPRDVVTRWNSTHDLMTFALNYRKPIDAITADKSHKLRKYELDNEGWHIIEQLVSVLQQYKSATLYFSQESACIAGVIPAMDTLNSSLDPKSKKTYHPSILAAMSLARKKMDRYYSLTDEAAPYRIAMVLHPGLKLEYFRQHEWQKDWIEVAEKMTREEFTASYEKLAASEETGIEVSSDQGNEGVSLFSNFSIGAATASTISELDEYLNRPVENIQDPLKWWIDNRRVYPNLSTMALDYLSIPPTSTAVERVFSKGRQILHFTRNRLSPSSIRAHLCLGSWARNDLVSATDLSRAIHSESKRKREEDIEPVVL